MEVSIVIPNYNGKELIEKNLPHVLKAKKYPGNNIKEIIIVDDGSYDDSVNFIKKSFPEIRLIVHKKNRGFYCAVNTGARMCPNHPALTEHRFPQIRLELFNQVHQRSDFQSSPAFAVFRLQSDFARARNSMAASLPPKVEGATLRGPI